MAEHKREQRPQPLDLTTTERLAATSPTSTEAFFSTGQKVVEAAGRCDSESANVLGLNMVQK